MVLAVPVGAPETIASLRRDADEVVCLDTPDHFYAIGSWYDDFTQADDEDVVECLRACRWSGALGRPLQ